MTPVLRSARLLVVFLLIVAGLTVPPFAESATAAGSPDVQLTKSVPATTLYGEPVAVTLSAIQTTGPTGFNLSFTDIIPAGTTIVSSSIPVTSLVVQPDGSTRVIWANVGDLQTGAAVALEYSYSYPTGTYDVGASFTGTALAYANSDPRVLPRFDAVSGAIVPATSTGSASATDTTDLIPFRLTKNEPSPEDELLRGVHDHKTVYSLTVTNNLVAPTNSFTVVDFLPASLEFLGCVNVDNSPAGTEEYPGAGRISDTPLPAMSNCVTPTSVTTVATDPDGAGGLPNGVYTRVEWTGLGTIAAGASRTISYAAAIPLQRNTASGAVATANLVNNTGAVTADEELVRNRATATGVYGGSSYSDSDTEDVTAEDVAVQKTVDLPSIAQGQTSTWTLQVQSSEYATSTGAVVITDTVPDGLDFGSATPAAQSIVTNGDGTLTATWSLPAFSAQNSTATITYTTVTRSTYRAGGGPVSANDSWSNAVTLATTATIVTAADGSTTSLPITDATSAEQVAAGLVLDKDVASPTAGPVSCANDPLTWNPELAGDYSPGDRVCFRLTVRFPGSLDTRNNVITDFLPAGFAYESWAFTGASTVPAGSVAFTGDAATPVLRWAVPTAASGQVFQVVLSTRITDPNAARSGDITSNLLKMTYENSKGSVFQLREQADVSWAEPEVALTKGIAERNGAPVAGAPAASLTIQAGDELTYRVTLTNTGDADATAVSVRDVIPGDWACSDIGAIGDGGTCSGDWIQWSGLSIAAGATITLGYTATAPADGSPGSTYVNSAGVRSFEGETNTGTPFVYVPSDNIDPALAADENTTPALASATVAIPNATVLKSATTSVTEAGNAAGQATIGELVTYSIAATIPQGSTLFGAPAVVDVVDTRLTVVGTPTFTINGGSAQNAAVSGQTVRAPLGSSFANGQDTGDDLVVLTVTARVNDTGGPSRGNDVPDRADLTWEDADGDPGVAQSNTVQTRIVEPNLAIAKSDDDTDGQVSPGQTISYTLTVTNTGADAATAHDLVVTDVLPAELTLASSPGGTYTSGTRTLTYTAPSLAPGATATFTYTVTVNDPIVGAGSIRNTATVTGTSLAGASANERTSTSPLGGPGSGYQASDSDTLTAPTITVAKSVSPTTRTIGESSTYQLRVTIPASVIAYDVTVIDVLPAGVYFSSPFSVGCVQAGGACSPNVPASVIGNPGPGDSTLGFFLGDLAPAASGDRVVTISYTGVVARPAVAGDALVNSATPNFNSTDRLAGTPSSVPAAGSFDVRGTASTATVNVVEPKLVIDKIVSGQVGDSDEFRARPGGSLLYVLAVTNTGTSTSYDAIVDDTPDPRMTGFAYVGPATLLDGDPTDGSLRWSIPGALAPGASTTITYSLTVPAGLDESDEVVGRELLNTADIANYAGVDPGARDPGRTYVDYDDVTPDTVGIELDLASIGDLVWFDVNGDGVRDAGEPGLAGVDVTVVFAGVDGVFGTPDDETRTTTTSATGAWLVDQLPGGRYRVTVDSADLPAGLAPSYDLDGGTASADGEWIGALGEADAKRDIDVGYTGTGSLGDRVWFDQDRDGVQDAAEAGLPGAIVTVTWGGLDGDLATTTDNVDYVRTTGANGAWLVDRLPAGPYAVTVTGLPTGFDVVSGPNGASSSSTVTLGSGENRLDQDFGFAGTGSIGDYVWLDRDGDGVQDASEDPIVGAVVELTWLGVDGVAGGADDATFTTTTGAAGEYLFDGLPPGAYVVAVTGALPAGATNSFDEDGDENSSTPVTLAAGENHLTADFGYDVQSAIGDRIWWDLDSDGAQDAGEPGLPGVTVNVLYLGADGVAGGGDDLTFSDVTDANGNWLVVDVPDGDYVVVVASGVPAGFAATYDADSGTVSPDEASALTLVGSDLAQDFGYAGSYSLGDRIWFDLNADGVQDAGEPGLPGVGVTLTWYGADGILGSADDVVLNTVTDADGLYSFGALPPGEFSVTLVRSTIPAGMYNNRDRDARPDETTVVTIVDRSIDDADFALTGSGRIGDVVWFDRDGDGALDVDEKGIPGVTVSVLWPGGDGVAGTADDETFTTVTDGDGGYLFENMPIGTGDFVVTVSGLPAGLAPTYDEDGALDSATTIPPTAFDDSYHLTADFGYRGTATIGDLVWIDLDGDGIRDAGEPGVPAQPVTVRWAGADGVLDTPDDEVWQTVTDADGAYAVDFLPDGDFRVTVDGGIALSATNTGDPDGGAPNAALTTITGGASDLDQDFGYRGSNSVGDTVFWDKNGDGVFANESTLTLITIDVTWFGPDGAAGGGDDIVFPTATTGAGTYRVDGLPDGIYRVAVTGDIPLGLVPSVDAEGAADGVSIVTLAGGVANLDQDFGYVGNGSIGDTVWLDLDGDGTRDAGEPAIPGVTVSLFWLADDGIITTTTDANGNYRFELLQTGDYEVGIDSGLPLGLSPTADPDGGDDDTSIVNLSAGEADLDQDFGYRGGAAIGDSIWLDVNGDGVRQANEPGVPGVTLEVRHAGADGALGTADDIVASVTTDAAGGYLVPGLPAGVVQVSYATSALPAGYAPSADLDGGDATRAVATLTAGETRLDADFVVEGTASISGVIYDDRDGDGVRDPGERGVGGVVVVVTWQGPSGPVVIRVTTAPDGSWSLGSLPPGLYGVAVDLSTVPSGFRASNPVATTVQLAPGGTAFVANGITTRALAITGVEIAVAVQMAAAFLGAGMLALLVSRRRREGGAW
ncbi:MAG: hypothetical protein RI885_2213 [Actinomycetota bacterium]